jgi:hypothetical protein
MKNRMFGSTGMKSVVRRSISTALVLAALAMPNIASAQGSRYSLTLSNTSGYAIENLYLSPSDSNDWGTDQLGDNTIEDGRRFILTSIRPGEYDIKFVDEDGDVCVLNHKNIFQNLSWQLSNSWLLNCEFH